MLCVTINVKNNFEPNKQGVPWIITFFIFWTVTHKPLVSSHQVSEGNQALQSFGTVLVRVVGL